MAVDIAPPRAPGAGKKKGLFSRLFSKKDAAAAAPPATQNDEFDLDEIRKKLGLDDAAQQPENDEPVEPELPDAPLDDEPLAVAQPNTEERPLDEPVDVPYEETLDEPSDDGLAEAPPEEPADAPEELAVDSLGAPEEPAAGEASLDAIPGLDAQQPESEDDFPVEEGPWDQHESTDEQHEDSTWDQHENADDQQEKSSWEEHEEPAEPAPPDEETHSWDAHDDAPEQQESSAWEEHDEIPALTEPEAPEEPQATEPAVDEPLEEAAEEQPAEDLDLPPLDEQAPEKPPEHPEHHAAEHFKELEEEHARIDKHLADLKAAKEEPLPSPEHLLEKAAAPGAEFILKNGQPITSLRDFQESMEFIDEDVFLHHVNEHRNDFASWVENALHEPQLADDLRHQATQAGFLKVLKQHARKAEKAFEGAGKKIDDIVEDRRAKLAEAQELSDELHALEQDLAETSAELAEHRNVFTDELKAKIRTELERQLADEKAAVQKERDEMNKDLAEERDAVQRTKQEAEQRKKEYEEKLAQATKEAEGKLAEQRAAADAREEEQLKREEGLNTRTEELDRRAQELDERTGQAEATLAQAKEAQARMDAYERDKERFAEDREKLKEEQRALAERKAAQDEREAALRKREEKAAKQDAALKEKEASLREDRKSFSAEKAELDKTRKALTQEQQKFDRRVKLTESKLDAREKKAKQAEDRVEELLAERRKIASYIEEAEQKISSQGGMQSYLKGKLDKMGPSAPPPETKRHLGIYSLIDQAREALANGNPTEARSLYNRIRQDFNKQQLSPNEKHVLYTTIRELYDDIATAA